MTNDCNGLWRQRRCHTAGVSRGLAFGAHVFFVTFKGCPGARQVGGCDLTLGAVIALRGWGAGTAAPEQVINAIVCAFHTGHRTVKTLASGA